MNRFAVDIKVLDLFSGIGGFSLGLERAGMKTIAFCEIEEFPRNVLKKHWSGVPVARDIRNLKYENGILYENGTPIYAGTIDVICGGDPCQRNSNAWRHGTGPESPAVDFIRIVKEVHPRIILRENPSRVRKDAPWPWWKFKQDIEDLGYRVLPFKIRACCVGAEYQGERLFLLGSLPSTDSTGLERNVREVMERAEAWGQNPDFTRPDRRHTPSRICRGIDGIPNRVDKLKALANAVDPRMSFFIGRAIMEVKFENTK